MSKDTDMKFAPKGKKQGIRSTSFTIRLEGPDADLYQRMKEVCLDNHITMTDLAKQSIRFALASMEKT